MTLYAPTRRNFPPNLPSHASHWTAAVLTHGYLRDITERRESEEKLRRSEAFLAQGQSLTLTGSLW